MTMSSGSSRVRMNSEGKNVLSYRFACTELARFDKVLHFSGMPSRSFRAMSHRRDFLKTTAAAGGVFLAGGIPNLARAASSLATPAPAPLKMLILGGTGYIGPHLVKHAVARGHEVTTFTRGRRNPELPET